MAYRIVKETYPNNSVIYRVQHNTIFGISTPFWWNCVREMDNRPYYCEYNSLDEAKMYQQSINKKKYIITRELINIKIFTK